MCFQTPGDRILYEVHIMFRVVGLTMLHDHINEKNSALPKLELNRDTVSGVLFLLMVSEEGRFL